MKKLFTTVAIVAIVVLLTATSKVFATGGDTLVVYAIGPSLDAVINKDTTSGKQAHSVYKLVSRDTTYIYLGAANVKSSIKIIGVLGQDGRPPCIQPGVLLNGSVPMTLLNLATKGVTCNIENLYVFELATNGTWTTGMTFNVVADSVRLSLNNVIEEENHYMIIMYSGAGDNFFIKNCKIKNGVHPQDWYAPALVQANAYLPFHPVDTLVMDYNTFFCLNGGAGGSTQIKYLEFVHNSVVYSFFNPRVPPPGGIFSAKINNNIFYGTNAGAISKSELLWMDDPYQPQAPSIISFDTLSLAQAALYDPADVGNSNLRMLAETKRNIEVKNNLFFEPKGITDFWTAWDDTSHVDSLITPLWMNARTTQMFSNKNSWPGFNQSGNQVDIDPGYGSSFANVLAGGTGYGVGLLQYAVETRTGKAATDEWGYKKQSVTGNNWIPIWPLPESSDMKYSNAALKTGATDGMSIGDPYWFNGITSVKQQPLGVPVKFDLSNNYPNPFNPTTEIQYSIPKSGIVTLKVYNLLGQEVMTLVNQQQTTGSYKVNFNASNLASGIYMYRLQSGNFTITKKMTLLK